MKRICIWLVLAIACSPALSQTPPVESTHLYDATGSSLTFANAIEMLMAYDVVLVGEKHDDSLGHLFEFELLRAVYDRGDSTKAIAVSLEMFDRDVQQVVDEYLAGHISEDHFVKSSRAWDNYAADYSRLVEFAREHDLPVIASNTPRRYVNRVSTFGTDYLENLPESAREHLPPLPVRPASSAMIERWYAEMASMMDHASPDSSTTNEESSEAAHGGFDMSKMIEAQNVWDAGMAFSIAEYMVRNPGATVIHYTGSFHIEGGSGLPDHLMRYRPSASIGIVFIEPVERPAEFDDSLRETGDIIVLTPKKSDASDSSH